MDENKKIIAIYSRKSKFTGKGESIGNQVEMCREYIRINFGEVDALNAMVFEDEGFSGGDTNRPAFKKMRAGIENKEFYAVVVYRLDRISRNVSDFSDFIENLSHKKIIFVSIREQFDTSTPMGRAMMYISSVFAQLERETIAERIRDNMRELAKTGRWLGGTTPTGYCSESVKSVTVDGKTKKACKLKLIPDEAEIVKLIFDLFIKYGSLTATEAELLDKKILTKNGNQFTRFSVKTILQNPVYMIADEQAYNYLISREVDLFSSKEDFDGIHGIMAYNRTEQTKGKMTVYKPMNEWIVSVGKHKGIIPGNVWVDVQNSLERNKDKSFRRPRINMSLLTGLLYCSCGSKMYPKLTKRKADDGKAVFTYVCKLKERSKKKLCDCRNLGGNLIDDIVIEKIRELAGDNKELIKQLKNNNTFCDIDGEDFDKRIENMKKEKADLHKKVNNLIDTISNLDNDLTKNSILDRINQMHMEIDSIDMRIDELKCISNSKFLDDIQFDAICQLLKVFKNTFDDMTCEQKRTAIARIVDRIIWDGENAKIVLFCSEV